MDVTPEYIESKFREFNALCFEGKLKLLPFRISRARTFLGLLRYKKRRNPNGKWHYFDFEFVVSQKCAHSGSEQEVEDVIIHEMIHYFILSRQLQDSGPHGTIFKRIMADINARFNRNITVSHKRTKEEQEKDTEVRQHLVCVVRFRDNRYGVAVSARTRLFELWDLMPLIPGVAEVTWYSSVDPYFNRFPRSTKPKLYVASLPELEQHLTTAKQLVRDGDRIHT